MAHAQSISQAAPLLRITQSALSRTILTLEKRLNTPLFARVPRGLILTQAGSLVFEAISEAFPPLESIRARLEDEKDPFKGDLHLRVMGGMPRVFLFPHLSGFLEKYPEIRLILSVEKGPPFCVFRETEILIGPSLADLASPRADSSPWVQVPLGVKEIHLYASRAYLKTWGEPQTPQDLDAHALIAVKSPPHEEVMNWHLRIGRSSPRQARIEVDFMEDALSLAEQGLGIAPAWAETLALGNARGPSDLVEVLSAFPRPSVLLALSYSAKIPVVQRLHLLKDYLQTALG